MATPAPAADSAFSEEIRPYKIHVSSRYLELTRQKLELTRLPHENPEPRSTDWWEPKPIVEPLIDFWLERYSWREEETRLNASVPQFRTSFLIPGTDACIRLHLIHAKSPHANAVPLLLIPPFPFTNLSLSHVIAPFTDPDDAGSKQPFHLVIPSLPGLGFSDALPNNTDIIQVTAEILNALMHRLGYKHYLMTNPGPSVNSPSRIDWKLGNALATNFQESCLGAHFISPPLKKPTLRKAPREWVRWKAVKLLKAPGFGYSREDLAAIRRADDLKRDRLTLDPRPEEFAFDGNGFREPNTLSYALCDSPIGLLLFVLMVLRVLGPDKELTPQELITLTELTWLPGPEATMRFWAHCASAPEHDEKSKGPKPKIAITTFTGEDENGGQGTVKLSPKPATHYFACPSWARSQYDVIATQRVAGKPGLLAWERPEVIVSGTRSLAKAILAKDKRMQKTEAPGAVLLEQVVVGNNEQAPADTSGTTMQGSMESQEVEEAPTPKPMFPETHLQVPGQEPSLRRQSSPEQPLLTDDSSIDRISEESGEDDDSSPDTVVAVGKKTTLPVPRSSSETR